MIFISLASLLSPSRAQEAPDSEPSSEKPTTVVEKAPTESEGVKVIEGQITDVCGVGLEGATVTARLDPGDEQEGALISETTTDTMGDFSIYAPSPITGDVAVTFSQKHFQSATEKRTLSGGDVPAYIGLTLTSTLALHGRVVNAMGEQPVGKAEVVLTSVCDEWTAESASDGTFRMDGWLPGQGTLTVSAETFGKESLQVQTRLAPLDDGTSMPTTTTAPMGTAGSDAAGMQVVTGDSPIIVKLKPERTVNIEVVNDIDKPVAQAVVELFDKPRDDFRTVMTDAQGKVSVRGLHFDASVLAVRLTHEDHVSGEDLDESIELPAKDVASTHKLVMNRAGRVAGTITDKRDGTGISGARVMTGAVLLDTSPRDFASYTGAYEVTGVAPGMAVVTVHADGYAPELFEVQVSAGQTTKLDIVLEESYRLVGSVRWSDKTPVAGAHVWSTKWRGHETLGLQTITDEKGKFVVHGAPSDEFTISVLAKGMEPKEQNVMAGLSQAVVVTLTKPSVTPGGTSVSIAVGSKVPDVTLATIDGQRVSLRGLAGKTVLLDFWATWCHPCVEELPQVAKVHEKYGKRKDFMIIGISRDSNQKEMKRFLKKNKYAWTQVFGQTADEAAKAFNVVAIPMMFIIGPDGKIADNAVHGAVLMERLDSLLKAEGTDGK